MRYVYDFSDPPSVTLSDLTSLLGGKGANLVVMATELGLPVPPGFTITTAACNTYLRSGWPVGLEEELRTHMGRLAQRSGRLFGDPVRPLLVSVRSGAPASMPGMMDTILNLGLNDVTTVGLGALAGDGDFAGDCLRRFREMYRQIVGIEPADDPWNQLQGAIKAVFESWNSDRARAYRSHEGIPDALGTAVTVQTMVFGNRGADSGTGVLFTRNPATGERRLYGDLMLNAQGEDVVAGTHQPQRLEVLDELWPALSAELRRYATLLERHYADLCDVEFTIESGKLWLLQVRVGKRSPQAALRIAVDMAEDADFPCSRAEAVRRTASILANPPQVFLRGDAEATLLTVGLPASPGVGSGEIAITSEAVESAVAAGRAAILVRAETSPADVRAMAEAAGILTARGGLASHAAVVARGWGIPAVVGAGEVHVAEDGISVSGRTVRVGEQITVDGATGNVYLGEVPGSWVTPPEAAVLRSWAKQLDLEVASPPTLGATGGATADAASAATTKDDVLRALLVRGAVSDDQLATALTRDRERVAPLLIELDAEGLVEVAAGGRRLTGEGKLMALALFRADGDHLGPERCAALLSDFHSLDARAKDAVTAWQLRDGVGQPTVNDHSDGAYDGRVLEELSDVHRAAMMWIAPLVETLSRFGSYRARLERALAAALDGDKRWVASPRVDSYHSVWFELHEDLIRLVGRSRSDEASSDGV